MAEADYARSSSALAGQYRKFFLSSVAISVLLQVTIDVGTTIAGQLLTSKLAYARKAIGKSVVALQAGSAYAMQAPLPLRVQVGPHVGAHVEWFFGALEGLGFFDWKE